MTTPAAVMVPVPPLPPVMDKLAKHNNNDRILKFRQTYRSFRTGEARGAKGEVDQFRVDTGPEEFPLNSEALGQETFATVERRNAAVYAAVTTYRLNYARFRQGGSRGAKGEVTAVASLMALEHVRSMPVAQRARLLKQKREEARPERPQTKFHLHFGGGRLGLGLLSPAIARAHEKGIPFALVDAPFGDYERLVKEGHERVNFYVNGEPTMTDVLMVTRADQLPKDLLDPSVRLFLCTTDTAIVGKVLEAATTVSTSMGPIMPKVVKPYFQKPSGKFIYCCENDHGMVETLAEELEKTATVVTCMVDRISPDRIVEGNNVYSKTEPHQGEIVILNPPKGAPLPAFAGPNVMAPDSEATADYFCRRKIGIVNGMHTTLAFMSLLKECKGDVAQDVPLIAPEAVGAADADIIRDFMVARLLLILYEHDTSVIKHAHNINTDDEVAKVLLDYGESTLKRYNTIKDKTSRVLGGGVANRWSTRLCNVQHFLQAHPRLGGISARLLSIARVDEARMRASIDTLVKDAERFVGQKPAWEAAP